MDFGSVKEDGKANSIKESDDIRVGGYEWSWRHVGSEDSGLVFLNSGLEEGVFSLVVKVVKAIFDGTKKGLAIVAWDWL